MKRAETREEEKRRIFEEDGWRYVCVGPKYSGYVIYTKGGKIAHLFPATGNVVYLP